MSRASRRPPPLHRRRYRRARGSFYYFSSRTGETRAAKPVGEAFAPYAAPDGAHDLRAAALLGRLRTAAHEVGHQRRADARRDVAVSHAPPQWVECYDKDARRCGGEVTEEWTMTRRI